MSSVIIAESFSFVVFIHYKVTKNSANYQIFNELFSSNSRYLKSDKTTNQPITEDFDENPNDIRFRTRGEELVPYMEIELPIELLTGIYVGYDCDFERTRKAIELYCTAHNYEVEIKKSLIK